MTAPTIYTAEYRGIQSVLIKHRGREIEVSISPKGNSIRFWIDGKETK